AGPSGVIEREQSFKQWLIEFKTIALEQGISEETFEKAFRKIKNHNERVIELDRSQPEVKLTFEQYLSRVVTKGRIAKGRRELRNKSKLINSAAKKYAVPSHYLVALWGMETDFGRLTGGFNAIEALATLAYEGRRSEFFTKELLHALKILDEGHTTPRKMKGSWAGALGQMQFMPSTFQRFAVDATGDNKKDIWNNLEDALASAANYLTTIGWKRDESWGREVKVPAGLAEELIGLNTQKKLTDWSALGVTRLDGAALPTGDLDASLIQLDGPEGRHFLVYNNFRMLMDWNRSEKYATAVGILADAIKR
ncbi:MAG: lytic murein transglycosylase, partial [Gammaproteobacteria bacterium]|nr:lytic murein transglycosylase [Gammaproteobacteria bacterium]